MRVGIFFDGKNFYSGWRSSLEGVDIDFVKLAEWLVAKVGGARLWGASYYTGIETGKLADSAGQKWLVGFLDELELLPGFFVHRFERKMRRRRCEKCGAMIDYSQEKEVDTTMVADMLRLAAVDAFDALILASGDSDHAPAVEGVRALGKQVYVATWGKEGLSPRTRKAAFDHIDLNEGLRDFATRLEAGVPPPGTVAGENAEAAFLQELARAESTFKDGYVGTNYFLRNWKSRILAPDFQARNRILQKLLGKGKVESYDAPDGNKALRICMATSGPAQGDAAGAEP